MEIVESVSVCSVEMGQSVSVWRWVSQSVCSVEIVESVSVCSVEMGQSVSVYIS